MNRCILFLVTAVAIVSQAQAQHEINVETGAAGIVFETTVCPEFKGFVRAQNYMVTQSTVTITTLSGEQNLNQGASAKLVEDFKVVSRESENFGFGTVVKYETRDSQGRFQIETIHFNKVTKSIRMLGQDPLTVSNCEEK